MSILVSAMLKLRGAQRWPEVEGHVYSYIWNWNQGESSPEGWATLSYGYKVGEEWQSGRATWSDPDGRDSYRLGDTIAVRYDPKHPVRSYLPAKQDADAPLLFISLLILGFLVLCVFVIAS